MPTFLSRRYICHSLKRKYATGSEPVMTQIGDERRKTVKTKGGGMKVKLVSGKTANVILKGKWERCEILTLVENPASRDFTRRNIITKGAILKVKIPDKKEIEVKVVSRPGQDGVINAIPLL